MISGVNLIDWTLIGLVGEPDLQLQPAGISQRKDVLNVGNVESKLYVDFDGLKIKNPIWGLQNKHLLFNSGGTVTNQY